MPADERTQPADPFTQFWNDTVSRMGMAAQPAPPSANDAMKQMQRMFLDALAKYCDDFMRSPQFLDAMKRQMDSALTFQQQVNQFLTHSQRGLQPAAQAESADLVSVIRGLKSQVESLQQEVAGLTGGKRRPSPATKSPRAAKKAATSSKQAGKSRRGK